MPTTVARAISVPWPADAMYRLVADVESYPEFLHWCTNAEIIHRNGNELVTRLGVRVGKIRFHVSSRNRHCPSKRIEIRLEHGPFRRLHGHWTFSEHESDKGSDVALLLEFEMQNRLIGKATSALLGKLIESSVDGFARRAEFLYGQD